MVKYKIEGSSVIKDMAKSVHVYVDGYKMRKYASPPHDARGKVSGVPTSDTTIRPFKFADIQTTGANDPPILNHSVTLTSCSRIIQMKTQCPTALV